MPRQRQPNAIRLAYAQALLEMQRQARALVVDVLVPLLPGLVLEAGVVHDAVSPRTYVDRLQAAMASIAERFFVEFPNERLRRLALTMAHRTSVMQRAELNRQLLAATGREIGVNVFSEPGIEERLEAFAAANAQLVSSVPRQFFDQVSQRVVQGLRSGERAEDLRADIADRYGVSQSRARLIARDQIGKLYGELNMARQTDLGIERFTWRTSEDERVRPEHQILDGQKFAWDKPPAEGIPGEPVNCRCTAEPDLRGAIRAL